MKNQVLPLVNAMVLAIKCGDFKLEKQISDEIKRVSTIAKNGWLRL